MKLSLNLGCGDRYVEGWTNVDHGSPHRKDLEVDLAGELPWEPWSVSRIYAGHLLEHLTYDDCSLLAARLCVCADLAGCVFVAVGPDCDVTRRQVADGTFDYGWGTPESIYEGAGRWAGDVHLWETTGPLVAELLHEAGWPVVQHLGPVQVLEGGWPVADRGPTWQYAVRAWIGPTKVVNDAGVVCVNDWT